MAKLVMGLSAFTLVLAACSAASATTLDANDDVDCFALAAGFDGFAQSTNAPADQRRATAGIAAWYAVKFDKIIKARGKDSVRAEVTLLAKAVDADVPAAKIAYMACTERAVADPSFGAFAARYQGR